MLTDDDWKGENLIRSATNPKLRDSHRTAPSKIVKTKPGESKLQEAGRRGGKSPKKLETQRRKMAKNIERYKSVSHLTRTEAAVALGVSYASVKMAAWRYDIKFKGDR